MKHTVLAAVIAVICWISGPLLVAKGSGGHGAGGHGGGHGSSGHGGSHNGRGSSSSHGHVSTSGGTHRRTPQHSNSARERRDRPAIATAVPGHTHDYFAEGPSIFEPFFIAQSRPRLHGTWVWPNYGRLGYAYYTGMCAKPDCSSDFVETYPQELPPSEAADGNLRLDVDPGAAQVFVDGYFVGTVEDFYHTLAGLRLTAGPHHLEFRAPGYETLAVDVAIDANRTITYRATLKQRQ